MSNNELNKTNQADAFEGSANAASAGDEFHTAESRTPYEKPRVISWSEKELEANGSSLSACVSFEF